MDRTSTPDGGLHYTLVQAVCALLFWAMQTVPCYFWSEQKVSLFSGPRKQLHCCFWSMQAVSRLFIANLEYVCPKVAGPARREEGLVFT